MKELVLNVVTPERSIVSEKIVEAVVLPSTGGQLTLLPGHINFITSLQHGTFGYRVGDDWQIAFLSGGFTQVFEGKVTVLAETIDMANELDVAQAELDLQDIQNQLKTLKAGTPEYRAALEAKSLTMAKIKAAQKKLH